MVLKKVFKKINDDLIISLLLKGLLVEEQIKFSDWISKNFIGLDNPSTM